MTPRLADVYRLMMQAREVGAWSDLRDWVNAAIRQWRNPDRDWWLKNHHSTINILARELSELTGASLEDCLEVVKRERGDSEMQVRIDAIFEFGRQIKRRAANERN
jgi:hypothetical protein